MRVVLWPLALAIRSICFWPIFKKDGVFQRPFMIGDKFPRFTATTVALEERHGLLHGVSGKSGFAIPAPGGATARTPKIRTKSK